MKNKIKVLVIDDEKAIRDILVSQLNHKGFDVAAAQDGHEGLNKINNGEFDIVITDLKIPGMDGIAITEQIKMTHPEIEVIVITGYPTVETAVNSLRKSVTDYIIKPFSIKDIVRVVNKAYEYKKLKSQLITLRKAVDMLISLIQRKDHYTSNHTKRVTMIATAIAAEMYLDEEQIESIFIAGMLHDIGNIEIPSEILNKPHKLNDDEMALIKRHPKTGYDILKSFSFSEQVAEIVLQHHERLNGSGYPAGLGGSNILIESKILAVADTIEALLSNRPFRRAISIGDALEELRKNKGTFYEPEIVSICIELFWKKKIQLD